MSQVFAADSVNTTTVVSIGTAAATPILTGNFLSPPFQNAKAILMGNIRLSVGTGATAIEIRIMRNPSAENLAVVDAANLNVTPGQVVLYDVQGADAPIGPGPVQYQLTVQQTGASTTGNSYSCNLTAFLISG